MTRPQATLAFLPVSNRAVDHRPAYVTTFSNHADEKDKPWYSIAPAMKAKDSDETVAEVMIYDAIGGWFGISAQDFVKELMAVDADRIKLLINSPGGDVFDGVAIYNALKMHKAAVTVHVTGLAASAASFIAQAGDEVIMHKGSMMMIHDASAMAWGDEAIMLETAEILSKISNNIAGIYAMRAGGKESAWREIMREEMWYSADEAVTAKLADSVAEDEDEDAQDKVSNWDLRVFNYAGRDNAPNPIEEMLKITNRAKETPVTPKTNPSNTEGTEQQQPPAAPAAPEAPATDPAPEQQDGGDAEEEDTPTTPAPAPEGEPTPTPAPEGAPPTVSNFAFVVNGIPTTDATAVQAHITTLENFFKDTKASNRKAFIDGLATGDSPKIMATQIEAMEKLVATMSDEQYDMWKASWEAAPSVALFAQHGPTDGGAPNGGATNAAAQKIEDLKATVKMHKDGGMKPEQIKNTDSYKQLVQLQPDYTL